MTLTVGSKVNVDPITAITWTAVTSAILFPKHVLGPPLKTGNSAALRKVPSGSVQVKGPSQCLGSRIAAS
ncbi:hypothetical protein HYQ46_000757 [Verticillium longisporum]|nr:hypothetical protein HYQ46_000757 [Verticillium longisporum]